MILRMLSEQVVLRVFVDMRPNNKLRSPPGRRKLFEEIIQ